MKLVKVRLFSLLMIPAFLVSLMGCQTMSEHRVASGAAIGTAAGALAGGIIGHQSGNRTAGALIGAATGAAVGGGIGYYLDRQAKRYQQIQDVQVQKVEAVPVTDTSAPGVEPIEESNTGGRPVVPEHLNLRVSSDVLFDRDSSRLKPVGAQRMAEIANVMQEYPESRVVVKGYTSSEGTEAYNLRLSEDRATMVKNQLIVEGVAAHRITAVGLGESFPISDNNTESGRSMNRRVEIEVYPNENVR